MAKKQLTTAERIARILRDNTKSPFCLPLGTKADAAKTARIQGKPLRG